MTEKLTYGLEGICLRAAFFPIVQKLFAHLPRTEVPGFSNYWT